MSGSLDVTLRLKLQNLLRRDAKVAAGDLMGIAKAADRLGGKGASKLTKELKTASLASGKMTVDLKQMQGVTKNLGGDMRLAAVATAKLGTNFTLVANKARDAAKATRDIGNAGALQRARREADALARSYARLGRAQGRGRGRRGGRFGETGREALSHMGGNAYLLGASGAVMAGGAIGLGAAGVGLAGYKAMGSAISFDKAMADVKKKVDLDPGATWADVEAKIYKASRATGIAANEMAALTAQAGQSGIAYRDLEGFMMLAAKASTAWDMGPKEASQQLAEIKAATQWTIPQLEEFADKVNSLGDNSAAAERDIVEMFKRSAAAAKAAGVDFDTTLAFTTALKSTGMQEEVASRFFNAFSGKLRTATHQSKKAQEGYKMLGLSSVSVEKGMKTDSLKTILTVLEKLQNHPDSASVAIKLFGQEWWDEAMRGGNAIPELLKNFKVIESGSYKGSMAKNMETTLATTVSHWERTKNLVGQIGDGLARWTLPSINATLEGVIQRFEKIYQYHEKMKEADKIGKKIAEGEELNQKDLESAKDPEALERINNTQRELTWDKLNTARKNNTPLVMSGTEKSNLKVMIDNLEAEIATLKKESYENLNKKDGIPLALHKKKEAEIKEVHLKRLRADYEKVNDVNASPGWTGRLADRLPNPENLDAFVEKLKTLRALAQQAKIVGPQNSLGLEAQMDDIKHIVDGALANPDISAKGKELIQNYANAIRDSTPEAVSKAQALLEQIKAALSGPITIDISPRLQNTPLPTPKPAAAGGVKKASVGGGVTIGTLNLNGVQDAAGLQRQLAALDSRARSRRDNSLNDIDSGSIG